MIGKWYQADLDVLAFLIVCYGIDERDSSVTHRITLIIHGTGVIEHEHNFSFANARQSDLTFPADLDLFEAAKLDERGFEFEVDAGSDNFFLDLDFRLCLHAGKVCFQICSEGGLPDCGAVRFAFRSVRLCSCQSCCIKGRLRDRFGVQRDRP